MSKSPVLPLFVKSLSGSDTVIGLVAAISPLAGILFSFPVGMLSDRLGKKRLLLVAAAVFLIAPLLYLMVSNPFWLIPIRFFHGIATAILGPVASAAIVSAYPETQGREARRVLIRDAGGQDAGPAPGGRNHFTALCSRPSMSRPSCSAYRFLVLTLRLKRGPGGETVRRVTPGDFSEAWLAFLRNGKLLGTSLVEMATYFAYGVMETYLPIYLSGQGVPAYQIGIIFSVQVLSIALTKPLFGRLADRVDRRVQVLAGIVLIGVFVAAVPLFQGVVPVAAIGILFGLAVSISTVATSTFVADVVTRENIGASLGALSSIMDIGHSAGPFIAGVVIAATADLGGFFLAGGVCILCALSFQRTGLPPRLSCRARPARGQHKPPGTHLTKSTKCTSVLVLFVNVAAAALTRRRRLALGRPK